VKRHVKYGLVCCWLMGAFSLRAATGLIGFVYDTYLGWLPADVEIADEADTSKRFAGRADGHGVFRFPDLPPGQYSIRATFAGFRDPTIHSARIQPGMLTDVGGIRLIASCEESPGMVCLGSLRGIETSNGAGKIEMLDLCAVDLREQKPRCPGTPGAPGPIPPDDDFQQDFQFHVANDGVWLIPLNGVSFSLNPTTVTYERGCPNATYAPGPIRVDSLPPGSRACVRMRRGGYAELRFEKQIALSQKTATLDFVYWGN
jgi:hypothetical protein